MKSDKNTETYLSKYIKKQNPYNQGEVRNKTLKKPIIYKKLNEIKHKKPTISSKGEQQTVLYTNKKRTQLKAKGTRKEILKDKNIDNCLYKYI